MHLPTECLSRFESIAPEARTRDRRGGYIIENQFSNCRKQSGVGVYTTMSRRMTQAWTRWIAGLLAVFAACIGGSALASGLQVVVTIPPLRGLVEPLLPEGSTVKVLMPPGRSEHNYEFTPSDMAAVENADLVVFVGMWLEPRVEKFLDANPSVRRVDVSLAEMAGAGATEDPAHEHGKESGGHKHDDACEHSEDPHVWLDPVLMEEALPALAEAVGKAMSVRGLLDEPAKMELREAEAKEAASIEDLDTEFREKLAPFKGAKIVTHHAAFGRLAIRYGLEVAEVIRVKESEEPTPGRVAAVVQSVKKEGVPVIFVEPQFNAAMAERVAKAAGVKVGRLDPIGDGDWFAMMRGNLAELVTGLSGGKAEGK